jgi:hypothetical protein
MAAFWQNGETFPPLTKVLLIPVLSVRCVLQKMAISLIKVAGEGRGD